MRVLHTESSDNWGGQEIRILKEAIGMRKRGHEVVFAIQEEGVLAAKARKEGFTVYDIDFRKRKGPAVVWALGQIIRTHGIQIINTHSSIDAWLGGLAARFFGVKVIRTRHLSTPIRKGINSRLLYNTLADYVVTTSSGILSDIQKQAKIDTSRCSCIPTGVEPFSVEEEERREFREKLGVKETDILVGTVCMVRSWKGIRDLMKAADMLRSFTHIKWVIVGGGYIDQYKGWIDLEGVLTFTGYLENPYPAFAALDVFLLLSTAHEGISQASLQAGFLSKPLITTDIGGLSEVCIPGKTGLIVPVSSSEEVAKAVLRLADNAEERKTLGKQAKKHVEDHYIWEKTLNDMEKIYNLI